MRDDTKNGCVADYSSRDITSKSLSFDITFFLSSLFGFNDISQETVGKKGFSHYLHKIVLFVLEMCTFFFFLSYEDLLQMKFISNR